MFAYSNTAEKSPSADHLQNYLPIEEYGLIGDMRSVALVGTNGSIDWFCYPYIDSPSVFGRILDYEHGGYFRIYSTEPKTKVKQMYWPDTNILITRFLNDQGVCELIDFMPVAESSNHKVRKIIRLVQSVRGTVNMRMECNPAFDYARASHKMKRFGKNILFDSNRLRLALACDFDVKMESNGCHCDFTLKEGASTSFIIYGLGAGDEPPKSFDHNTTANTFKNTVKYWENWLSQCTYKGRWRETVHRSALALKLLTFEPTGAIVAAPTCSLPEGLGGERNWDYRYTWIRDAAFTVYAFLRIGFTKEAEQFMGWVEARCHELKPDGSLQNIYGVDGRHDLAEKELDHLEGYKGSRPVRTGNGAANQLQLDIYGELLDAVYLYDKYGTPISYDLWCHLKKLVEYVCKNWHLDDEGVWEVRGGKKPFVYSKLMCWVTLDRAIRLADKRSFPCPREKWLKVRDKIYEKIMTNGWNQSKGAFVQYFGSETLDAANLMMPLTLFISPTDTRIIKTLEEVLRPPEEGGLVSNGLVYRYNIHETDDGLRGEEGTFNICTFWLVEALARAGVSDKAYLEKSRLLFEKMLGFANHLGLYAEETGNSGESLGNFPQAFTHLALISAAFNLDRALG